MLHATFVLWNAIIKSKAQGKRLYTCAIDASKAFDKVNRLILWYRMIKIKINLAIKLAIMLYYNRSEIIIVIENGYSDIFDSEVGVRQCGPLSPELFSIYIEPLLEKVKTSSAGIRYKFGKLEIIGYADDLLILGQTRRELQELLNIIELIGRELEIKFDPKKTLVMVFNQSIKRTVEGRREDAWHTKG